MKNYVSKAWMGASTGNLGAWMHLQNDYRRGVERYADI